MNPLIFSINAVFPLILVAAFGFYARRNNTLTDEFLKVGNKFCYKYGFFFMMFTTIYDIESFNEINWYVILFAVIGVLLLFFIGLIYIIFFVKDPRQKGVIHQAFYRSNFAIIGMPLAMNIFGDAGLEAAAMISAFTVPLFNVLAVISLSLFVENKQEKPFAFVAKEIVKNPLIQGVVTGLICLAIRPFCNGWRLSTSSFAFLYKAATALGDITPWLCILILGGNFKISDIKNYLKPICVCVPVRLILAPTLGMGLAIFLPKILGIPSFSGAEYTALFSLFAASEAVATVSMADQMNGDAELAGQVVVWTTLLSSLTLFLWVALFRGIGIFM